MNYVAKEIGNFLQHYGTKRHSGRYPWGSGENPYQHSEDWLSRVEELREFYKTNTYIDPVTGKAFKGDTAVAKSLKMETPEFRAMESIAKNERRMILIDKVTALAEDGKSPSEIGRILGKNESSIRSLLNEDSKARTEASRATAERLKSIVDEYGMTDVGKGVSRRLGVSEEKLNQALYICEADGYKVYGVGMPQVTNRGKQTNVKVLCPPGTEYKDAYDFGKIHFVKDPSDETISYDQGASYKPSFIYPASLDSKRIGVRYAEEGGIEKDGVVELRRGVADISLGDATYAQVRILVDGTHYIKGMAVYSDDLPDGVDVLVNSKKPVGTELKGTDNEYSVLKKIKKDPTNPFGATIKEKGGQSFYDDPNGQYTDPLTGKKQSLSVINKKSDEGDWDEWKDKLPAQFLSKQNKELVTNQLNLAKADKRAEFDEICALTNPTVKKNLLLSFAEDCDSAAVHLSAAALPKQKFKVILPLTTMKDNEVYAPGYENGETVALIRYPHEGIYQIPILKVNNKNAEGKRVLGTAPQDAIGLTHTAASQLSGADFDGDTVMIIPCNSPTSSVHIEAKKPVGVFEELKDYDPSVSYPERPGMKHMTDTQGEMGRISNLITDMTLIGASDEEMVRATKHAMCVIDAEKHHLDYKRCYEENGIQELKDKYQGHYNEKGNWVHGASTIVSRAKSQASELKTQGAMKIDPETGKKYYNLSDQLYYQEQTKVIKDEKTGESKTVKYKKTVYPNKPETIDPTKPVLQRTQKTTKMAVTDDAFTLVSEARNPKELLYAEYANSMKALANEARKEYTTTGKIAFSKQAKETYSSEVASLNNELKLSEANAPRERQAQAIANSVMKAKTQADPSLKDNKKEYDKLSNQELLIARSVVGAKRHEIVISDNQWAAIQAGAIPETTLNKILKYADSSRVRELATPRNSVTLTTAQINRINALEKAGYTLDEISKAIGVSTSTISKTLRS